MPPSYYTAVISTNNDNDDSSLSSDYNYEDEFLHRMNGLRQAYFRHLSIPTNKSSTTSTGIDGASPTGFVAGDSTQYVALHHFHPRVVRKLADKAAGHGERSALGTATSPTITTSSYYLSCRVPWTMKAKQIRRLGLEVNPKDRVKLGGRNNSNEEICNSSHDDANDEYYFVPNYLLEDAYQDLKQLSRVERSTADISHDVYQKAKEAIKAKQLQKQQEAKVREGRSKRVKKDGSNSSSRLRRGKKQKPDTTSGTPPQSTKKAFRSSLTTGDLANSQGGDTHLGETNATLPGSRYINDESISIFQMSTTPIESPQTANDGGASGALDSAVAGGGKTLLSTSASSNLYASTVSIQVTDPLLQASDSTFHESDLTVRASGAATMANNNSNSKWNTSDTTLPVSNVSLVDVAGGQAAARKLSQLDIDFPLEELPKRQSAGWSPSELPASDGPKKAKSMTSIMSDAATEPPLEPMSRRQSDGMLSCATLAESTTLLKTSILQKVEPIVGTSIPEEMEPSSAHSSPMSSVKVVLTVGEMDTKDESGLLIPVPPAPKRSLDFSPSTPKRILSARCLEDTEGSDDDTFEEDMSPIPPKQVISRQCDHANNLLGEEKRDFTKEELQLQGLPARSDSGSSETKRPRRSSTDMLSFLDSSERKSRGDDSRQSRSSSQPSVAARKSVARTKSAESNGPRRRGSHFAPLSKSDSSSGAVRRRSDASILTQRAQENNMSSMEGSAKRSILGASRTIDTTWRAMQHFSQEAPTTSRREQRAPRRTKSSDPVLRKKKDSSGKEEQASTRGGRRPRRRTRSTDPVLRAGNGSPTRPSRRGRRKDVVASNGDRMSHSAQHTPQKSSPIRRTKSVDTAVERIDKSFASLISMRQLTQGKRPDDRSPQRYSPTRNNGVSPLPSLMRAQTGSGIQGLKRTLRSLGGNSISPPPPLMRAKTGPVMQGSKKTSLRSLGGDSNSASRSPRRSPVGQPKSELSAMMSSKISIKRIDSSLRAMKHFVHETGTATEGARAHSPKRIRSRLSPLRTRSLSPKRWHAGTNGGMSSSSPAILGARSRTSAVDLKPTGHEVDDMSKSSPANLSHTAVARKLSRDHKADSCPALDSQSLQSATATTHTSGSAKNAQDFTRRIDLDVACKDVLSQSNDTPSALSELGSSNTSSKHTHSDLETSELAAGTYYCESPAVKNPMLSNTKQTADMKTQTIDQDGSMYVCDIGSDENSKETLNHQSLYLGDLDEQRIQAAGVIPKDFNFSYPVPANRRSKHDVEWEVLGFYSPFPSAQRRYSNGKDPTTFSLPRRLAGQTVRKQLMSEVVVVAHRRQSKIAKEGAGRKAKRPASQLLLIDLLSTFQEKEKSETSFSDEVAKTADAFLEGDRIGRLSTSACSSSGFGASKGHLSLDLDDVFVESHNFQALQQDRPASSESLPRAPVHQDSSLSLSLRRIFEESGDSWCEEQKTSQMKPEQLRALFPFKRIRERKKNASATSHGSIPGLSGSDMDVGQSPSLTDSEPAITSTSTTRTGPRNLLVTEEVAPSNTLTPFAKRLSEIAEEIVDVEKAVADNALQDDCIPLLVPIAMGDEHQVFSPPPLSPLSTLSTQEAPRQLEPVVVQPDVPRVAHQVVVEVPKSDDHLDFQPTTPGIMVQNKVLGGLYCSPAHESRPKAQSLRGPGHQKEIIFIPTSHSMSQRRAIPSVAHVGLSGAAATALSYTDNVSCGYDKSDDKIESTKTPITGAVLRDIVISPHRMFFGKKFQEMETPKRSGREMKPALPSTKRQYTVCQ